MQVVLTDIFSSCGMNFTIYHAFVTGQNRCWEERREEGTEWTDCCSSVTTNTGQQVEG